MKIAKKLGNLLTQQGITVAYTRTTDVALGNTENKDLQERVRLSNEVYKPKYFISIHNNAHDDKSIRGTETFITGRGGEAEPLAEAINEYLVKETGLPSRGVKVKSFYVLKNTDAPAVLVEVAFLSNLEDEKLLNDDAFLDKASTGIAKGIVKYLGKQWKNVNTNSDEAWSWAIDKGIFMPITDKSESIEAIELAKALYKLFGVSAKTIDGDTLLVEIDPMVLKCKNMVLKTGKEIIKQYSNFINANFFLWDNNGKIKKTIGWMVSEGKILCSRYEHKEFSWSGNPKGTFLIRKNGSIEVGWKWDRDLENIQDNIWFCVQGFNLFPLSYNLRDGMATEGWSYDSVGYKTNRVSIGYNSTKCAAIICVQKNSNAEEAQKAMVKYGCKNNAICLDSGLSCNAAVDGEPFILTNRQLANIIYW